MSYQEISMRHPKALTWLLMLLAGAHAWAQVPTEVPAPVPGAKPVTVDHISIHGTALEGNLEGNAVNREVFVFLPPEYSPASASIFPS